MEEEIKNSQKAIAFIGQLSDLVEQHNRYKAIIENLWMELYDAYGVRVTPEDCVKVLNKHSDEIRNLLIPDFDDSE